MLRKKMEEAGVLQALEDLGYHYEEIFGQLSPEVEQEYAAYSWQKVASNADGIRKGYVIHAVPPEAWVEEDHPWEEWFFQYDEPHHHVLFRKKQECCQREVLIPDTDMEHPKEVCGKYWQCFEDPQSLPYLAGKKQG